MVSRLRCSRLCRSHVRGALVTRTASYWSLYKYSQKLPFNFHHIPMLKFLLSFPRNDTAEINFSSILSERLPYRMTNSRQFSKLVSMLATRQDSVKKLNT